MWATSKCVFIVLVVVSISLLGLHSLIEICANGIIVAGVTYLVDVMWQSGCLLSSRSVCVVF
jgi:hypothetical protein